MSDEKKTQIHVVSIQVNAGESPPLGRIFFVRHHTPASARDWLLKNAVESRVASQDDVEFMARAGIEPIGLAKVKAAGEPEQVDGYDPPATPAGHID